MGQFLRNLWHASDKHFKTFGRKYEILHLPFSLLIDLLHLLGVLSTTHNWDQSTTSLMQRYHEYFVGFITNRSCPLALIWLSTWTGIHIKHLSSLPPSVLQLSLSTIHNNGINASVQGLKQIFPDFKTKRYLSWQWWVYVLFSYWQSHSALCFSSALFFVPSALHLFLFSTLHSHSAVPFSSLPTRRTQYVGSNSGEVKSKVSLCLLRFVRIKARRLLRSSHKLCSCPQGAENERQRWRRKGHWGH